MLLLKGMKQQSSLESFSKNLQDKRVRSLRGRLISEDCQSLDTKEVIRCLIDTVAADHNIIYALAAIEMGLITWPLK